MFLQSLRLIALLGTIAAGLVSLVRPRAVVGFTGLTPQGGRGITEIRAVLGALFVALGLAPLILNAAAAYQVLGIAYLGVALARAVSMVVDDSVVRSNTLSLVVEVAFGVVLIL